MKITGLRKMDDYWTLKLSNRAISLGKTHSRLGNQTRTKHQELPRILNLTFLF